MHNDEQSEPRGLTQQVTRMLDEVGRGNRDAANRLIAAVYAELRALAVARLRRETPGQTLQATALVHEAYVRLMGDQQTQWENRAHFFAAAAEAMRRILIESARRKERVRHGGEMARHELSEVDAIDLPQDVDLLALDEALEALARLDAPKAELVKLRYFAGMTVVEAGRHLGISRATADRHWTFARAWLYNQIRKGRSNGP